jgi:hypothetical protein
LAIGSYRYSVSHLIPEMTQMALQTQKKQLIQETPISRSENFKYRLSRSEHEKEWGKDSNKPGFGTRVLSTLLRYMPKIGPFKAMAFNVPTPQTEDMYFKSINVTVDRYQAFLHEAGKNSLVLPDRDLGSGKPATPGEYTLTDNTLPNCWPNSRPTISTRQRRPSKRIFWSPIPICPRRMRQKGIPLNGRVC